VSGLGGAGAAGGAGRPHACCPAASTGGSRGPRASGKRSAPRPQADPCRPVGSWGAGRPTDPDRRERAPPSLFEAKPKTSKRGGCPPPWGGVGARSEATRRACSARRQSRPCGLATARRGLGRQPGRGASHPGSQRHRSVSAAGARAHPPGSWLLLTRRAAATVGAFASRSAMQRPRPVRPAARQPSLTAVSPWSHTTVSIEG